jgi:hypothetical protein
MFAIIPHPGHFLTLRSSGTGGGAGGGFEYFLRDDTIRDQLVANVLGNGDDSDHFQEIVSSLDRSVSFHFVTFLIPSDYA